MANPEKAPNAPLCDCESCFAPWALGFEAAFRAAKAAGEPINVFAMTRDFPTKVRGAELRRRFDGLMTVPGDGYIASEGPMFAAAFGDVCEADDDRNWLPSGLRRELAATLRSHPELFGDVDNPVHWYLMLRSFPASTREPSQPNRADRALRSLFADKPALWHCFDRVEAIVGGTPYHGGDPVMFCQSKVIWRNSWCTCGPTTGDHVKAVV